MYYSYRYQYVQYLQYMGTDQTGFGIFINENIIIQCCGAGSFWVGANFNAILFLRSNID